MKLVRAKVQNYRSIVDSGEVKINDGVTVVIGKNEQGKTNFLKALSSFNRQYTYSPRDFPNHLRPRLEDKPPAGIAVVTLWLEPDPVERGRLEKLLKKEQVTGLYKVTRHFDGHYTYEADVDGKSAALEFRPPDVSPLTAELKAEAEALRSRLTEHSKRAEGFAPALEQLGRHVESFTSATFSTPGDLENVVRTFAAAVTGLPGQDPPIQEEIASAIKKIEAKQSEVARALATDPVATFAELIPAFVIHSSTVDRVPDEVGVADFVSNPEGTSRGMANLCKIAGLSIPKIQELAGSTDVAHRETYEDHYSASISGGINEFWTQAEYNVHFRIDRERLSVSISDDSYSPRIAPTQRSDGFQWYLSFYSTLLAESSGTNPLVLLLDNPGLELHADGQKDVKRFLEAKLPRLAQVIYVTHSPAMIDPFNLEQVRIVRHHGETSGTRIENWAFKGEGEADVLEPVRSAIGASLVTSLMFNDFNVLVEGAADKVVLEGAFAARQPAESKRIQVNGSVSETPGGFLPRFYQRAGLPFVVFLDADEGGRKLAKDLEGWGIPKECVVELGAVITDPKGRDFELEDILSADLYHTAVKETYPDKPIDKPKAEQKKRTKTYEAAFEARYKIGFNKRRVGETVKRLLLTGRGDTESLEALGKITTALLETAKKQLTGKEGS